MNRCADCFLQRRRIHGRSHEQRLKENRALFVRHINPWIVPLIVDAADDFVGHDADYFPRNLRTELSLPGNNQLGPEIAWEVVGVVANEIVSSIDDKGDNPGVYVSNEQSPVFFQALLVRAAMDPAPLQKAIVAAVHEIDKDQPLTDMKSLEQIKSESMASNRLQSMLLGVFAGVAVLLSAIGIYGVISYSVAQRTHEMGIRAALGASTTDILGLVLRAGMWMTGIGLVVGLAGTLALSRLLATLLFGVGERDPVTIGAVAAILGAVALLACYIPAHRATRVDPMVALRYE